MSYLKTKGIVLREINTGEADKIVTIFTKNQGKVSGIAKGARRPKSKFVAGTQFLSYSEFVLFKGHDLYSINSCDLIESFYNIRNDMAKLTYSSHFSEIVNDVIQENQPATKVLQLFLNTLHILAKTEKNPELLARIFEIRLLSIIGYAPYVRGCLECGNEDFSGLAFSFRKCGLICKCCIQSDKLAVKVSSGTARTLNYIVYSKLKDLFSFEVSEEVLRELGKVSKRYLRDMLDRDYSKLDFLKNL
jgi:DNA repair protein RecO (recombination protein O)